MYLWLHTGDFFPLFRPAFYLWQIPTTSHQKEGGGEGAATHTENFFEKQLDPESPYLGKK